MAKVLDFTKSKKCFCVKEEGKERYIKVTSSYGYADVGVSYGYADVGVGKGSVWNSVSIARLKADKAAEQFGGVWHVHPVIIQCAVLAAV